MKEPDGMSKGVLIYVGGYGRSGSTLLDSYLSSSKGVTGIGEFSNYLDDRIHDRDCSCGKKLSRCPFWGPLNKIIVEDGMHHLSALVKANEALSLHNFNLDKEYVVYLNESLNFFFSSSNVVVDSSKTTRLTFFRAINISKFADVFFVHLYRSPDSLMSSLKKGSNKYLSGVKERENKYLFIFRSVLGWVVGNLGAVYSSWKVKRGIIVSYEQFCSNPEALINELKDMGVAIDVPEDIVPGHGVSGNRMRSTLKRIESSSYFHDLSFLEKSIVYFMKFLMKAFLACSRYKIFKIRNDNF